MEHEHYGYMQLRHVLYIYINIYVGVLGYAHDAKVLALAMQGDPNFSHPPISKYYLVDSGYGLHRGYLISYRQSQYHPSHFQNQAPPNNYKEKFNRLHSSLRLVTERTFRVWKGKWKIMHNRARYDVRTTKKLVVETMALHNFVRKSNILDPDFEANWEQDDNHQPSLKEEVEVQDDGQIFDSRQYMEGIRDDIAMNLWNNHR
ncbi:putative protein [Arabidopsis thaliana]|uniref:Uncharacterized protein AT4g08200 n=1 Tax=Arabidopsis thaliana TaxID=3702 RepID=Q9SUG0_ARATH|nr:putative protein [Arabidopsis thaliana]CAB81156.1 putative protein [Arabidopsis thaliana]